MMEDDVSGDYWDEDHARRALDERMLMADRLWEEVYDLVQRAWADIEAGRPTFEEDEAKTTEQFHHDDELRGEQEVSILRECVHEIVRTALLALRP
jgi:hypothetical protein